VNMTTGEVREPQRPDQIDPKGRQMRALWASLNDAGLSDRDKALSYLSALLDREISSTKELTVDETIRAVADLKSMVERPFPTEPPAEDS
jgi:hypothetical protein